MSKAVYLIDSNSFIAPYKTFYQFGFAKNFWDSIQYNIEDGRIAVLDLVKDEIISSDDELADWFKTITIKNYIDRRQEKIVDLYSDILEEIRNNDCYKPGALKEWAKINVADPWLIAAASVYDLKIVTFESPNKNLNSRNPSKCAKIPDIADCFGVEYCDLYQMMNTLKINLSNP